MPVRPLFGGYATEAANRFMFHLPPSFLWQDRRQVDWGPVDPGLFSFQPSLSSGCYRTVAQASHPEVDEL